MKGGSYPYSEIELTFLTGLLEDQDIQLNVNGETKDYGNSATYLLSNGYKIPGFKYNRFMEVDNDSVNEAFGSKTVGENIQDFITNLTN